MTHDPDQCPNCQRTHEEQFQDSRDELNSFFGLLNGLPLSIKARVYDHVRYEVCVLHELLKDCETPEQQSLGFSLHSSLHGWGGDDIWFELQANIAVRVGYRDVDTVDADLYLAVQSCKSGYDKPVLQAIILCDSAEGDGIDASAVAADRACQAMGILVFRFTKAEAMNDPVLCVSAVHQGIERMLTIPRRAGWLKPKP